MRPCAAYAKPHRPLRPLRGHLPQGGGSTHPPADPHPKLPGDPNLVTETLSPSTASNDQITKLAEYRPRPGVEQIMFIDPDTERVRVVAARSPESSDADWLPAGSDLPLASLGIVVPYAEIFAEA